MSEAERGNLISDRPPVIPSFTTCLEIAGEGLGLIDWTTRTLPSFTYEQERQKQMEAPVVHVSKPVRNSRH
jgi:hypothetical protein